jgi:hypothetical protein
MHRLGDFQSELVLQQTMGYNGLVFTTHLTEIALT